MAERKAKRTGCILLASVWLVRFSVSASSWNTPLRIAVQSSLSHHSNSRKRFHSLLVPAGGANMKAEEEETRDPMYEEEWNALFQQEENEIKQVQYASLRTTTTINNPNSFDQSRGFRQTLELPAFLTRSSDHVAYNIEDYEEDVVPVAAISVSTKVPQASFSPALQPRREPTLNQRKQTNLKPQATATAAAPIAPTGRPLVFWENMVCGAISRSVAQSVMHPANTMKTLLQQPNAPPLTSYLKPNAFPVLFRGAGANFVLSVPHGAINFAVLEMVRKELSNLVKRTNYSEEKIGPALDFMSSAISTICCSIVSTPQMMITDNIMAGNYPNLPAAIKGLMGRGGLSGFYARGWWPGLVGKIPSYALTWTFFQQLKEGQQKLSGRKATNIENSIMGCIASGTTVCIMIPMDTIKTRLVTQATANGVVPYKGIVDCAVRVAKEEGIMSFYRGLPPRLVSVVPMIGIQFTVYEAMKRVMQKRALAEQKQQRAQQPKPFLSPKKQKRKQEQGDAEFDPYSRLEQLQESCMEVAASPEHPYPAPHFLRIMRRKNGKNGKRK